MGELLTDKTNKLLDKQNEIDTIGEIDPFGRKAVLNPIRDQLQKEVDVLTATRQLYAIAHKNIAVGAQGVVY